MSISTTTNTGTITASAVGTATWTAAGVVVPSGTSLFVVDVVGRAVAGTVINSASWGTYSFVTSMPLLGSAQTVMGQRWYVTNPAASTSTLTVAWSAAARGGGSYTLFSGVSTATPFSSTSTSLGVASTKTLEMTSTVSQWILDCRGSDNGDTVTLAVSSNQTSTANFIGSAGAGANALRIGTAVRPGAAGTSIVSWTRTGAGVSFELYYAQTLNDDTVAAAGGGTTAFQWITPLSVSPIQVITR